jgi:DNA-binding NarL/FixJ family response regulator
MAEEWQWRVLVVDNHTAFRETVRHVLAADPQFVVVAEASSGEEAVAITRQISLDLVLMDIRLPGMNGLAAAAAIKANQPQVIILMLSCDWSPAYERTSTKSIGS